MHKSNISPDEAIQKLQEGNGRYTAEALLHPNVSRQRWEMTGSQGQTPFAGILACADSRVPVELIFDQGIGDVFVVRVAGNTFGPSQLGSTEYAVDHLGVSAIVVLGHTKCGAVKAVYEAGVLDGHLQGLTERILPAVETVKNNHPQMPAASGVDEAAKENVWNTIEQALSASDSIRYGVRNRQIKVVGAIYNVETGKVQWMGHHPREAQILG